MANLTLASAGRVRGVSESGGEKLAQLGKGLAETNERVKNYTEISKISFKKEASGPPGPWPASILSLWIS